MLVNDDKNSDELYFVIKIHINILIYCPGSSRVVLEYVIYSQFQLRFNYGRNDRIICK